MGLTPINETTKRKKGDPRIFLLRDKVKIDTMNPATDTPLISIPNIK